jgi:hypothetical protein
MLHRMESRGGDVHSPLPLPLPLPLPPRWMTTQQQRPAVTTSESMGLPAPKKLSQHSLRCIKIQTGEKASEFYG